MKYGTPRENVLGLKAVTGAGEELHRRVTKLVGYDLTRLIIGRGHLAIVTGRSRLTCRNETHVAAVFPHARCTAAVVRIMAQPNTPCALEFMDGHAIK